MGCDVLIFSESSLVWPKCLRVFHNARTGVRTDRMVGDDVVGFEQLGVVDVRTPSVRDAYTHAQQSLHTNKGVRVKGVRRIYHNRDGEKRHMKGFADPLSDVHLYAVKKQSCVGHFQLAFPVFPEYVAPTKRRWWRLLDNKPEPRLCCLR